MKIKRLRQIDYFFLIIIVSFAFDFGNIKYLLAGIFVVLYFILNRNDSCFLFKNVAAKSFILILKGLSVLFLITMILQIKNGFNSYAINELIYFLTPLIVVWAYTTFTGKGQLESIINYVFVIYILSFVVTFSSQLTIENIRNISFVDSYSPFESESAFYFFVFECYYLVKDDKKKSIIALFLCILSFKRLCLLVSVIVFLISWGYSKKKCVSHKTVVIITIIFILLPVITCIVLDSSFDSWFYSKFSVSLDELTLSRSSRIEMAQNSGQIKYGIGSVTTYMTQALNQMHGSNFANRNLHNDLVRIYLECGIIGSIAFTYTYIKATSFSRPVFILISYVFLECYFNHLFGAGTTGLWIIIYLFLVYSAYDW